MTDLNWKKLSSNYLFNDLWFTIRRDTCITPLGKTVDPYYVYEFPDWVTAVAITENNEVILERQYRHALGETIYEIPGGCVDPEDESLEVAIARELREETGYTFSSFQYLGKTSANPSTNNNWMHMFLALGGKKVYEQQLDHNEEIEIHLKSPEQIQAMIERNLFPQSMHTTALLYAGLSLGWMRFER